MKVGDLVKCLSNHSLAKTFGLVIGFEDQSHYKVSRKQSQDYLVPRRVKVILGDGSIETWYEHLAAVVIDMQNEKY